MIKKSANGRITVDAQFEEQGATISVTANTLTNNKRGNMNNNTIQQGKTNDSKELALHYMQTLADVARESFLILDSRLKAIGANPTFYQVFQVSQQQTENKFIYELGNGQWDIPALRGLLEKILPGKKIVRNYVVTHTFESIGTKTMLLNAKQIDSVQLIILAIEDITEKSELEEKLADYTRGLEEKISERTQDLAGRVKELEELNKTMVGRELKMIELKEEIAKLKKQV